MKLYLKGGLLPLLAIFNEFWALGWATAFSYKPSQRYFLATYLQKATPKLPLYIKSDLSIKNNFFYKTPPKKSSKANFLLGFASHSSQMALGALNNNFIQGLYRGSGSYYPASKAWPAQKPWGVYFAWRKKQSLVLDYSQKQERLLGIHGAFSSWFFSPGLFFLKTQQQNIGGISFQQRFLCSKQSIRVLAHVDQKSNGLFSIQSRFFSLLVWQSQAKYSASGIFQKYTKGVTGLWQTPKHRLQLHYACPRLFRNCKKSSIFLQYKFLAKYLKMAFLYQREYKRILALWVEPKIPVQKNFALFLPLGFFPQEGLMTKGISVLFFSFLKIGVLSLGEVGSRFFYLDPNPLFFEKSQRLRKKSPLPFTEAAKHKLKANFLLELEATYQNFFFRLRYHVAEKKPVYAEAGGSGWF